MRSGGVLVLAAGDVAVAVVLRAAPEVVEEAAVVAAAARQEALAALVRPGQVAVDVGAVRAAVLREPSPDPMSDEDLLEYLRTVIFENSTMPSISNSA